VRGVSEARDFGEAVREVCVDVRRFLQTSPWPQLDIVVGGVVHASPVPLEGWARHTPPAVVTIRLTLRILICAVARNFRIVLQK
jgi:hypothetical protein